MFLPFLLPLALTAAEPQCVTLHCCPRNDLLVIENNGAGLWRNEHKLVIKVLTNSK
jgi:hypothetical protein